MTREQYRVEAEKLGIVAGPVDPDAEDFNELLADDVIESTKNFYQSVDIKAIAAKSDVYEAFYEKYCKTCEKSEDDSCKYIPDCPKHNIKEFEKCYQKNQGK